MQKMCYRANSIDSAYINYISKFVIMSVQLFLPLRIIKVNLLLICFNYFFSEGLRIKVNLLSTWLIYFFSKGLPIKVNLFSTWLIYFYLEGLPIKVNLLSTRLNYFYLEGLSE